MERSAVPALDAAAAGKPESLRPVMRCAISYCAIAPGRLRQSLARRRLLLEYQSYTRRLMPGQQEIKRR